jgi:hypothetical protein
MDENVEDTTDKGMYVFLMGCFFIYLDAGVAAGQ